MVAMKQRRRLGSRAGLDLINGSGSSGRASSSTSGSILSPLLFGLSSEHPRIDLLTPAQALEVKHITSSLSFQKKHGLVFSTLVINSH
jgi:hypothetical protein